MRCNTINVRDERVFFTKAHARSGTVPVRCSSHLTLYPSMRVKSNRTTIQPLQVQSSQSLHHQKRNMPKIPKRQNPCFSLQMPNRNNDASNKVLAHERTCVCGCCCCCMEPPLGGVRAEVESGRFPMAFTSQAFSSLNWSSSVRSARKFGRNLSSRCLFMMRNFCTSYDLFGFAAKICSRGMWCQ